MKKALYVIVIMILIIAFCVSAFLVARYVLEGKKQADRYEDLANIKNQAQTSVPTQATKPSTATEPSKPGFEVISDPTVEGGILLDYAELHEMNPDMAGWIKIEGTKVDYPVMQTSTNNKDYYLKRDFDKQDSVRGSIYAREECDLDKPSDNITIYGHNMADGSMFHSLMSAAALPDVSAALSAGKQRCGLAGAVEDLPGDALGGDVHQALHRPCADPFGLHLRHPAAGVQGCLRKNAGAAHEARRRGLSVRPDRRLSDADPGLGRG